MICFHHNDLDGRCAAAIIERWKWMDTLCPRKIYIEMDYNKIAPIDNIQPGEQVMIVDFSFKPEVMAEVLKITPNVVWIDHHTTAKDYDYGKLLAGIRDFTNKGRSGCELTWQYCHPEDIPRGVMLIGDYDSWRLKTDPECFQFYEGLKLYQDQSPTAPFWNVLLQDNCGYVDAILKEGRAAIMYRDAYCEDFIKQFGYETELDGVKGFAVNLFRFGSKAYGKRMQQYPMCIGYAHDGNKFIVSLYSEQIDVSIICKNHGGGGHKGAAGFQCKELPFLKKE